MKKFKLFNEWRGIYIYGDDLANAILRQGKFQKPDRIIDGRNGIKEDGEYVIISRIIGYEDTSSSTRGNHKYTRVVAECEDKKIFSFDATEEKVKIG